MSRSPFRRDHSPPIGAPETLAEDLSVVTAGNGGPMTFTGTRTYILGGSSVAVIDPGPREAAHLAALKSALAGRTVEAILVTHAHMDHAPLARDLADITDAPVYACGSDLAATAVIDLDTGHLGGGEGVDRSFRADHALADGDRVEGDGWTLEAIFTPGHLNDHMCFSDGARLFSGDHVMGWATSMISPPEGNLTAFMASLEKLTGRSERTYLPGHGDVVEDGLSIVAHLITHRKGREAQVQDALAEGPATIAELTARIYRDVDPSLHGAAARNVLAHLIDLVGRDVVHPDGEFDVTGRFY